MQLSINKMICRLGNTGGGTVADGSMAADGGTVADSGMVAD